MGQKAKGFLCLIISFLIALTPFFNASARTKHLNASLEVRLHNAYWWNVFGNNCKSGYTAIEADAFLEDKGENENTIFSYLVQNGFSNTAAAAIMGNLKAESGAFNPRQLEKITANADYPGYLAPENFRAYENGSKTYSGGLGLAQWTSAGRVKNLQDFADRLNLPVTSLSVQTRFLVKELLEYGITPELLNSMDLRSATSYVLGNYEKPLDQSDEVVDTRTEYASSYVSYEAGEVKFYDSDISDEICISDEDLEKGYQDEYEQIDIEEIIELLQDGGMSLAEAQSIIQQYLRVSPDQYSYYNIDTGVHNGSNSPLYNCVAFVRWFVKEYYDYNLSRGSGDGWAVAGYITNGQPHSVPEVGAVFSWSNNGAGHTGVVLGINGDTLVIGEASYHGGWAHVKEVNINDTRGWRYAYAEDMKGV